MAIQSTDEGLRVDPDANALFLESDRLEDCLRYVQTHDIPHVIVKESFGFRGTDLAFLRELPSVRSVTVAGDYALGVLTELPTLTFLSVEDSRRPLDLASLPHLRTLRLDWHKRVSGLTELSGSLRELSLWKYRDNGPGIGAVAELSNLRALMLTQCRTLKSLDGLAGLDKLKQFQGNYLSKLESVEDAANARSLEVLRLEVCKRIRDLDALKGSPKLRELSLTNCGEIESIAFIRGLAALRRFSFVQTKITDGDMAPCVGLEYAGFIKMRHYSHSAAEIAELSGNEEAAEFHRKNEASLRDARRM